MEDRATGRSTRLVDMYVQEFFTSPQGTSVLILDHWDDPRAHRSLLDRVISRLRIEHPGVHYAVCTVTNSIMRMP